jgi:hypothetical protein
VVTARTLADMTGMLKSIKLIRLTNSGAKSCTLQGYPDVRSFTNGGQPVPLDFGHSAQTLFGVPLPVVTVTLQPRGSARVFIGIGYYNCDGRHNPGRVVVTLPGDPHPLALDSFGREALCAHESVWVSPVFSTAIDPFQQPH